METQQPEMMYHFESKQDVADMWVVFKPAFSAIGYIHDFGNVKYAPYSWINHPTESFATIKSSLGSVTRHLIYHHTGQFYDYETKALHLMSALTRCHMLMGTYYAQFEPPKQRERIFVRDKVNTILDMLSMPGIPISVPTDLTSDQLTPEILISCMKCPTSFFTDLTYDTAYELCMHIICTITDEVVSMTTAKHSSDIYTTIYPVDVLLWATVHLFNLFTKEHPEQPLLITNC